MMTEAGQRCGRPAPPLPPEDSTAGARSPRGTEDSTPGARSARDTEDSTLGTRPARSAEDSEGEQEEASSRLGPFWCPLGALSSFSADLGSRLASGLAKLDWPAAARPKMPLKGVKSPLRWCRCLKKDEPPEITYCVSKTGDALNLQMLTPTQPMPKSEDVEAKFLEVLEELDLTAANRSAMLELPLEKKWQLYCSRKKKDDTDNGNGHSYLARLPDYYIDKIHTLTGMSFPSNNEDEVTKRTKQLESLRTALRTQPNSFVLKFLELQGLEACQRFLNSMDHETAESSIHSSLIGCVKALMNNTNGRAHVLAHPEGLNVISQSLSCENVKTKVAVLEILGAVCLVPGGHRKALESMVYYQRFAAERTRFQRVVNDLDRSTGVYADDVSLKTAIMSFVNAVLSYGAGKESLEFRLHLRYEFLMLGIQPVIDKLRGLENETLDRHLDFFEMVRTEDERELAKRYEQVEVDTRSAPAMFDLLQNKLNNTAAYPHLLSLLQHCLLLPLDYGTYPQHWMLFDRICQQMILQSETGEDCDLQLVNINVNTVVQMLAQEEELRQATQKAQELGKENVELLSRLGEKEQECDLRTQERDDLAANLARLQEKYEAESMGHLQAIQRLQELQYSAGRGPVKEAAITDEAKISNGKLPAFRPPSSPTAVPPPPPPPPPGSVPPPPPPMINGGLTTKQKNIPKASNPLKSFNWSKLPAGRIDGTIWNDLDEERLYAHIDLLDVDRTFSAYQRQNGLLDGSLDDLTNAGTLTRSRAKVISVIDARRAQNCTILLSKLKLTDKEIKMALMAMDSRDQLPPDMVEQLLKFTPSAEEKALLEEHSDELKSLARADRFLYEISQITHYEARLKSLFYKKRFAERQAELRPRISAVVEASKELQRSRRLKKLLELILAFGNYMNRGQRGNAQGFRLESLRRIGDTKSSTRRNVTLLHYIVQLMEAKFPDVLRLQDDMANVREAAKVSMSELQKEMTVIRTGLREMQTELEFQRSRPADPADLFVPTIKDFTAKATYKCRQLEDEFSDMRSRFESVVSFFGEDPASTQPDEFFGIFDTFLASFQAAIEDNANVKRKREEEERRLRHEQELKQMTLQRRGNRESQLRREASLLEGKNGQTREFDDLISALRTGEVFSESFRNARRKKKTPPGEPRGQFDESRERSIRIV